MRHRRVGAGVGTATIYLHCPTRADLIVAVYRHQVEACPEAGPDLLPAGPTPYAALGSRINLCVGFLDRFVPVRTQLLEAATETGEIHSGVGALQLMRGVGNLCVDTTTDPYAPTAYGRVSVITPARLGPVLPCHEVAVLVTRGF